MPISFQQMPEVNYIKEHESYDSYFTLKPRIYLRWSITILCVVHNLRQLFGDISSNKHSLQIDPKILNNQPVLNYFRCRR